MIQLPEHPLPVKPKFESPCNGCGLCCHAELCVAAQIKLQVMKLPLVAPCRYLHYSQGRTYCGLVMEETRNGGTIISKALMIGEGCSMPDELLEETELDRIRRKFK